jgi:5-methylcytosine-specific restriction endonuclease McrA
MYPHGCVARCCVNTVLLLNQNYEPLNVCRLRRAVVLVAKGKAEPLETYPVPIKTGGCDVPRPSVIRMRYYVRRPRPEVRLSRSEVFHRDGHECQYCGARNTDLTIDHVVPRRLGGVRRWENLVTACRKCNLRKAGRTPHQANMLLRTRPGRPRVSMLDLVTSSQVGMVDPAWHPYLPHILLQPI